MKRKKEIVELRVYSTFERLRWDYTNMAEKAIQIEGFKLTPYKEIYIPDGYRCIFKLDKPEQIRGLRVDKFILDEYVSAETRDYLESVSPKRKEGE